MMNKELEKIMEDIYNVGNQLYIKSVYEGITKNDCLDVEEKLGKLVDTIKKSITPPTEKEVCEALSEWFDEKFYYDIRQQEFYTKGINIQHSVVKMKNYNTHNEVEFRHFYTMPPHLITLIGRFYEGKADNE